MPKYYDNTRLSAFKVCPRLFYLRHRRHWRPVGTAPELVFGLSWHAAMDQVWAGLNANVAFDDVLKRALVAFEEEWTKGGFPGFSDWTLEHNERYSPRSPGIAAEMIYNYMQQRKEFIQACELIQVEMPFAAPLTTNNDGPMVIGRQDKVIRFERPYSGLRDGVYGIEHKTTSWYSKATGFRQEYIDSFSPNSQVDGYNHGLHMNFEKVRGVLVDAALVHKTVHDKFRFIPCDRLLEQLDAWLNETLHYIEQIEKEDALLEAGSSKTFMEAFPKNTESCAGRYGRACVYRDICRFRPDPSKEVDPPEGFVVEKWEPFEVLKLSKIGLPPEENGPSS